MTCEAKLLTKEELEEAMEPLSADAESRVCGHIAALATEAAKVPGLEADNAAMLAAIRRWADDESDGDDAYEALLKVLRVEHPGATLLERLAKAESERDAAQQEAHRLSNALALEQTTRDRAVGEADTLRERVATLGALAADRGMEALEAIAAYDKATARADAAEARVKELTVRVEGALAALSQPACYPGDVRLACSFLADKPVDEMPQVRFGTSQHPPAPAQCSVCGKPATCWGRRSGEARPSDPACGECCAHDTGECERIASTPTPPAPAQGVDAMEAALQSCPCDVTAPCEKCCALLDAVDRATGAMATPTAPEVVEAVGKARDALESMRLAVDSGDMPMGDEAVSELRNYMDDIGTALTAYDAAKGGHVETLDKARVVEALRMARTTHLKVAADLDAGGRGGVLAGEHRAMADACTQVAMRLGLTLDVGGVT